ncbi:MAG: ATP-binding protein [Nitrososphaeraceae archaeon]
MSPTPSRRTKRSIELANIKTILDPRETVTFSNDLVRSAKHEILRIYPSIDQFYRHVRIGVLQIFREALERGISVRVLVPGDRHEIDKMVNEVEFGLPRLDIRSLDKSLRTQMGILVVDRKKSVIIELKDDTKDSFYDAAGVAAYSNSKPIAISYASIFETLWKQGELYEQSKAYNAMQREFINIAAHELRTPIQPILGLSQVLLSEKMDRERTEDLLLTITRNAERLQRLVEDILDVSKIESQSLHLKMQKFNLTALILSIISDHKNQFERQQGNSKKLTFTAAGKEEHIYIVGDMGRISQVLSNLLSNAIKFIEGDEGEIVVSAERKEEQEGEEADKKNIDIVISVKDTGTGIHPEIFPRLFTKFASKSERGGMGLGLYISKGIVEAHGGRIWAENNPYGKGATFTFIFPLQ